MIEMNENKPQNKTPIKMTPCRRIGLRRTTPKSAPTQMTIENTQLDINERGSTPMGAASLCYEEEERKNKNHIEQIELNRRYPRVILRKIDDQLIEQTPTTPLKLTDIESINHFQHTSDSQRFLRDSQKSRYRLSLNKRVRDKFTKKKLDFIADSLVEDLQTELSQVPSRFNQTEHSVVNTKDSITVDSDSRRKNLLSDVAHQTEHPVVNTTDTITVDDDDGRRKNLFSDATLIQQINRLKADIEWKKLESEAIKKHEINIKELQDAIQIWEDGYHKALELLKARFDQSHENILNHFNIPLDLFKD